MAKIIIDNLKTLAYALLLAGLFRTLLFQPFWIPSGSMKDTLLIGDFLFVNKFAYGYSRHSCPFSLCPFSGRLLGQEPERGDVIVFKHPVTGEDYIKRLVGLPGDSIQMRQGVLFVNGEPSAQEPDGEFVESFAEQGPHRKMPVCARRPDGLGADCVKERFIETLPGDHKHSILNSRDNGIADSTGLFTVPPGEYFFMGDNRDNSQDSRFGQSSGGVGTVPFANLVGRADRVIFSSAGRSLLYFWRWRHDRFFEAVN